MMSALFSISTRRVSISLYQRARCSSLVQASDLPTESLYNGRRHLTSAAGARKQVPKKKWENKPKPPRNTSFAELGLKLLRPPMKFTVDGVTYTEKLPLALDEKVHQKATAAAKKHAEGLFRKSKLKLKRDAEMRQKNIGDLESGEKGSYWQQLRKYFF